MHELWLRPAFGETNYGYFSSGNHIVRCVDSFADNNSKKCSKRGGGDCFFRGHRRLTLPAVGVWLVHIGDRKWVRRRMALGFDISAWFFVCSVGYTYQSRSVFVCRSSGKEVARRIEEDGGEPALFEVNSFQQREPNWAFKITGNQRSQKQNLLTKIRRAKGLDLKFEGILWDFAFAILRARQLRTN